jgi:hypothetical protein
MVWLAIETCETGGCPGKGKLDGIAREVPCESAPSVEGQLLGGVLLHVVKLHPT